ncbi:hypothetical protein V5F77_14105 [Xanthobacter sp. DSM 24535]|uniref:hypothetical protein n=1 Tax=Roseixanthobacter psychrophilus TaxID=3119917 RepID=UPI00372AC624
MPVFAPAGPAATDFAAMGLPKMKMRLGVALAVLVVSGGLAAAADAIFPRGTLVGLVPPDGMVESQTFSGFEDRSKAASILIIEMPAQAYPQVEAGFTDAALATKGITVESRGPLVPDPTALPQTSPFREGKSLLVIGKQTAGPVVAKKWILLAGSPKGTALVTVQLPEANTGQLTDEAVRKSLATLAFRAPPSTGEQLAGLPFKLGELAGFRVVKVIGNTAVVLTEGDKDVVESASQPIFVVGVSPGTPREDDRGQFALRSLSSVPAVRDIHLERAEPLRIGGQPGFEIIASAKDATSGADVKVIQWLRFGANAHIRMITVVKADAFPDTYTRVRAIRDGLETN